MPGYLLNINCEVTCAHGGKALPTVANLRVKVGGAPIPIASAPFVIAGCPNQDPPKAPGAPPTPAPCTMATFLPPTCTTRVKSNGQPLLCESSKTDLCASISTQPPQPLGTISDAGQKRVKGT